MNEAEGPSIELVEEPEYVQSVIKGMQDRDPMHMSEYLCEVCGKTETLTEDEAFKKGWDYPPFMGMWGVVSPRTCGTCTVEGTAWYWIVQHPDSGLPENHMLTVLRILAESRTHGQ